MCSIPCLTSTLPLTRGEWTEWCNPIEDRRLSTFISKLQPLRQCPGSASIPADAGEGRSQRSARYVLGTGEVGGQAARRQDRQQSDAAASSPHVGLYCIRLLSVLAARSLATHLRRFPIRNARIAETGPHQHRRVCLRSHIVVGAVASDKVESLPCPRWDCTIRSTRPVSTAARAVKHGIEHIHERNVRNYWGCKAPGARLTMAPQFAAGRTARRGNPRPCGKALSNQEARHVHEIVEGIGALLQPLPSRYH